MDKHSNLSTQINNQVWMEANLNLDSFRNGDLIPQAKTVLEWRRACENELPVWLYFDFNISNGMKYGKLYNWWAINDSRGLAPKGWHIPSDDEWSILLEYLKAEHISSSKLKIRSDGELENKVFGTNESGSYGSIKGYPSHDLVQNQESECGGWWSSSGLILHQSHHHGLNISNGFVSRAYYDRFTAAFSVRCLKD